MNQGTGKMDIFRDVHDRRYFLELAGALPSRFGLEVHAYAQLANHYHLLVRSQRDALSRGMQWFGSRYARRFNRRHDRVGAFFRHRFTSRVVTDDEYLDWLPIYIHLNPTKDGFVKLPEEWPWSSYRAVVGLEPGAPGLSLGTIHNGITPRAIQTLTRSYERTSGPYRLRSPDTVAKSWQVEQTLDPPLEPIALEGAVADCLGVSHASLFQAHRGNTGRSLCVVLADRWTDLSRTAIAARYGLANAHSVASVIRRTESSVSVQLERQVLIAAVTPQAA